MNPPAGQPAEAPAPRPEGGLQWGWGVFVAFIVFALFSASNSPKASEGSSAKPALPSSQLGTIDYSKLKPATASNTSGKTQPAVTTKASDAGGSRYDPTYRPAVGSHYVSGYYRKNGTYVSGYYRTNPDRSFWNNYSSAGNVNPSTGKVGTKLPPGK